MPDDAKAKPRRESWIHSHSSLQCRLLPTAVKVIVIIIITIIIIIIIIIIMVQSQMQ